MCNKFLQSPLTERVEIYITDATAAARVAAEMATIYGGSTCTTAAGHWINADGDDIADNVAIVYSHTTRRTLKKTASLLVAIAQTVKREHGQDAVSVVINNKMYFI